MPWARGCSLAPAGAGSAGCGACRATTDGWVHGQRLECMQFTQTHQWDDDGPALGISDRSPRFSIHARIERESLYRHWRNSNGNATPLSGEEGEGARKRGGNTERWGETGKCRGNGCMHGNMNSNAVSCTGTCLVCFGILLSLMFETKPGSCLEPDEVAVEQRVLLSALPDSRSC